MALLWKWSLFTHESAVDWVLRVVLMTLQGGLHHHPFLASTPFDPHRLFYPLCHFE